MGNKTLKIELTEEQSDALGEEAKAKGVRFFDHCRAKLMAGIDQTAHGALVRAARLPEPFMSIPAEVPISRVAAGQSPAPAPDDRLSRLEAMMMRMAETVNALAANPLHVYETGAAQAAEVEVDVNDVVTGALGDAERQGLTMVERDPAPENVGGVRSVGPRPRSAYSVVPRHLQDHFG